jgi:drug/metabolite transporter (DMT)-like permease
MKLFRKVSDWFMRYFCALMTRLAVLLAFTCALCISLEQLLSCVLDVQHPTVRLILLWVGGAFLVIGGLAAAILTAIEINHDLIWEDHYTVD